VNQSTNEEKLTVEETKSKKESFTRWQDYRIKQLSFTINLFLTFAIGILGYELSVLNDSSLNLNTIESIVYLLGISIILASIIIGICCVTNRLKDFRITAKITLWKYRRYKEHNFKKFRNISKRCSRRTYKLLKWQIITLFGSILVFFVLMLIKDFNKLFTN